MGMKSLRALREGASLSRSQLSELSGVSARSIEAYETSEMQPRIEAALALARALGVSVEQLAGDQVTAA